MNLILFSLDNNSECIAKKIMDKGIYGLSHLKYDTNVIPINIDISIILISESDMTEHFNDIRKISSKSDISYIFVYDMNKTILSKLTDVVDLVFPIENQHNPVEYVYWTLKGLIESFTTDKSEHMHQMIGIDSTDIKYITRKHGWASTTYFKYKNGESLSNHMSDEFIESTMRHAIGCMIAVIGSKGSSINHIQVLDEYVRQHTNADITIVMSFIRDSRMTEDGSMIVIIFTGIR